MEHYPLSKDAAEYTIMDFRVSDSIKDLLLKSLYPSTLAARYYIYTCRLREIIPKTYSFTKQLKYYPCIEREILRKKDFEEKWRSLLPFSFLDNPSVD